jgi:hypothetical protein
MLKRYKPWRKISEKRLAGLEAEKETKNKDHAFFQEIWEERGGVCQITGERLGLEPLTTMFHHILPKAKYPQYRYCRWNILLIQPVLHTQIESDLDKVPEIKQLYLELMKKHAAGLLKDG